MTPPPLYQRLALEVVTQLAEEGVIVSPDLMAKILYDASTKAYVYMREDT